MSYAELPLIITENILRHAMSHSPDMAQWKHQLNLISVCGSWRTTGLPLVYRRAYILGASEFGTGISHKGFAKNAAAHSNLRLILDTQNVLYVRTLHIELLHPQYLAALAEQMHDIFGQRPWLAVSELTLEMAPDGMSEEDEEDDKYVDSAALAECFRWYMPNVLSLNHNVERWFGPGVRLAEHLAFLYAGQLVALSSNSSSVTQGLLFSLHLSTLDIVLRPGHILPRIVASSIVSLKLRDVSPDFCWTHLVDSNLTFDRLRKLEVNYVSKHWDGETQEDSKIPAVYFPLLSSFVLSLSSFDQIYTVLCSGYWKMPNVQHLEIHGYDDSLVHLLDPRYSIDKMCAKIVENLPHVQKLAVSGNNDNEECSHLAECLALGYANQLQSLRSPYPIDPAGQIFSALASLKINASLGYSLDIILQSAPTLHTLSLDTLSHGFSWIHFSDIWKFPMLENLNIVYDDETRVDLKQDLATFIIAKKTAIVECPRLKRVGVNGASYTGLQSLLAPGQSCWPEVTTLEVVLASFDNIGGINAATEPELKNFGMHIFSAIPNVRHLCCSGRGISFRFANLMYQTMITAYACNLYSLQCTTALPTSILSTLQNIEKLDASFSSNSNENSDSCNMQPQKIRRLQLSCVPAAFSWSWLGASTTFADDSKGYIEMCFNSLESLSMSLPNIKHYQIEKNNLLVGRRILLNMPKITSLALRAEVANSDIAASELYLGCIGSVSLHGIPDALPLCGSLNAVTNAIDIVITATSEDQGFYRLTNSWLNQYAFINYASLKLTNISFALDPHQISWPQLTELTIESTLRLETLVALLHKLNSLEVLKVGWILADTITSEIAAVENIIYSCLWIEPVNMSLKSLEINALAPECVPNVVSLAFKYLLLVAPSLEKMYAPEDISFSKTNFISQLAQVYPHLNNIIFNDY